MERKLLIYTKIHLCVRASVESHLETWHHLPNARFNYDRVHDGIHLTWAHVNQGVPWGNPQNACSVESLPIADVLEDPAETV